MARQYLSTLSISMLDEAPRSSERMPLTGKGLCTPGDLLHATGPVRHSHRSRRHSSCLYLAQCLTASGTESLSGLVAVHLAVHMRPLQNCVSSVPNCWHEHMRSLQSYVSSVTIRWHENAIFVSHTDHSWSKACQCHQVDNAACRMLRLGLAFPVSFRQSTTASQTLPEWWYPRPRLRRPGPL